MTGRRIVIFLAALAVPAGAYKYVEVRRELAAQRAAIRAAWGEVEDAMGKRAELVPALVEMARRGAKREPTGIVDVMTARSALVAARAAQDKIAANAAIDAAATRLVETVAREKHPRKDRAWRNLVDELDTARNRIAQERQQYNETVKQYNTNIQLFPKNVVAWLGGFARDDEYFKTETGASRRPR